MTRTAHVKRPSLLAVLTVGASLLGQACGGDDDPRGMDAAVSTDGGGDAAITPDAATTPDAGPADAGSTDAGMDGGPVGDGGPSFACTLEELTPIAECAAAACVSLPEGGIPEGGIAADASLPDPGELATCILTSCGTLLLGVSADCRTCLIAGVGMDIDEITMRCTDGIAIP